MLLFDVVFEVNMIEVKNVIEQLNKEILMCFDFKGFDVCVEQKECELMLFVDDDFKFGQVKDVLIGKLVKCNVDVCFFDYGKVEKIGGDKVKQIVIVKKGVMGDFVKKIVCFVKDSKIKVQVSIQGDVVCILGMKCDDLQSMIVMLCKDVIDMLFDFNNFCD